VYNKKLIALHAAVTEKAGRVIYRSKQMVIVCLVTFGTAILSKHNQFAAQTSSAQAAG